MSVCQDDLENGIAKVLFGTFQDQFYYFFLLLINNAYLLVFNIKLKFHNVKAVLFHFYSLADVRILCSITKINVSLRSFVFA